MSNLQSQKKKLQKELNAIEKLQERQLIEKNYPAFKRKYEGKFFKTINGYGGDTPPWFLYRKVTEIRPSDIYDTGGKGGITAHFRGWSFQITSYNQIQIEQLENGYVHHLEEEISEAEFNAAWNKMIDKLDSLK
jgi:hypothetical protein